MPKSPTMTCEQLAFEAQGKKIVQDLNAQFVSGQLSVIIGANGAGKSTWLELLAGLLQPSFGKVAIGDRSVTTSIGHVERARLIAWVPGSKSLPFAINCYDLVMLGRFAIHRGQPTATDHQRVRESLELMQLDSFRHRDVRFMSSGEQQRAALARGLVSDAPILLFDEPTTNLDIAASLKTWKLLKQISRQKRTVLVATHELLLAQHFADHFFALKDGSLVGHGSMGALSPELLHQVFGIELRLSQSLNGDFTVSINTED